MPIRTNTNKEAVNRGWIHSPDAGNSVPGLVLIHDVWGLSEHSQGLAAELAAEGFVVLEIDLYREREGPPAENPGAFIQSLSDPEILQDLDDAAVWMKSVAQCRDQNVGVVGVCMGGTYALLASLYSDRYRAAAAFYGILSYDSGMLANPLGRDMTKKPHSPLEVGGQLKMPLLASFGCDDPFVPGEDVDALEGILATSRERYRYQVDRYEGAGHAFLNRTRAEAYHAEAAAASWSRLIPFLKEELA